MKNSLGGVAVTNFLGGVAVTAILFILGLMALNQNSLPSPSLEPTRTPPVVINRELPPVDEMVIDDSVPKMDGYGRKESKALTRLAMRQVERMAETNSFQHSDFTNHVNKHGVMRENIAYSDYNPAWDVAYGVWAKSPPHTYNRQVGGKYMGYASMTKGNRTYFAVIYAEKP